MSINITGNVSLLRNNQIDSSGVAIPPLDLDYGQIAINYNAKDPCIFIKVLGDNGVTSIQKFVGEAVIAKTLSDILGESAADLATLKDLIKQFEGSSSDVLTLVKNIDAAVALKADTTALNAHKNNNTNPHSVTKAQVGLANVRNVAQLGQTETAANSTLFNGLSIDQMPIQTNFQSEIDMNDMRNGIIGGKLWNAINAPHNFYSFLSVGYDKYKMQFNAVGHSLQFRAGDDTGLDNKTWVNIWNSSNSNNNQTDWTARSLRSISSSSGATPNCQVSMSGGEGASNAYCSWTSYNWYDTNWRVGIIRGGGADYNSFAMSKNGVPFVSINDTDFVSRNRIGIGCNPIITLAIGDYDTGFHWVSDGQLGAQANGVEAFNWNTSRVYFNVPIQGASSASFDGDIVADSNGTGNCFIRKAIEGYGWGSGSGALTVDVRNNSNQTPLFLSKRENSDGVGDNRLFSIEQLNDGNWVYIGLKGVPMLRMKAKEALYIDYSTEISSNLIVKGEATTYSLDGVEARTVAAASATRLADLEDVDLTGASDNFVLYRSNVTNANGDKIWKARKETDSYTELKNIPSEFTPVAHNHIGSSYVATPSDRGLKTNVSTISNGLNTILSINPVTYNWTDEAMIRYGFKNNSSVGVIAQELEDIIPTAITQLDEQYKAVDYIQIIPHLIGAIKQLNNELANKNIAIDNARKDYKRAYGESVNLKKELDLLKMDIEQIKSLIKQNLI